MFFLIFAEFIKKIESHGTRIVGCKFWAARVTLIALTLALFGSTPSFPLVFSNYYQQTWKNVVKKFENPLYDPSKTEIASSHDSKLTFRLTVPMIGWALGLGPRSTLILFYFVGVSLLYMATRLGERVSRSREVAFYMTLTVASIWPGITSFVVLSGGVYDGVAILLLLCALLARSPAAIASCVFLAEWTDERGILASPLVLLFHGLTLQGDCLQFQPLRPQALAVPAAWVGYATIRFYLACHFGLSTSQDPWFHNFVSQIHLLPIGLWTALEGGWILVIASLVDLWFKRRKRLAAWFLLALSPLGILGIAVLDVTRSMAYLVPAIFLAIKVLREYEDPTSLKRLCLFAALVSVSCPNYYADNFVEVEWLLPLPLSVLRWATWAGQ